MSPFVQRHGALLMNGTFGLEFDLTFNTTRAFANESELERLYLR